MGSLLQVLASGREEAQVKERIEKIDERVSDAQVASRANDPMEFENRKN